MIRVTKFLDFNFVDECAGTGGSFKWRGVAQQIQAYTRCELGKPVVTFTSGNHGVAVALHARQVGQLPTVIVPEWVEHDKWLLLKRLGCNVIKAGLTASDCEHRAFEVCREVGGFMAHPYRSHDQIVGYMSLWSEIAQVFPEGADIVVPVGSGGLLSAGVLYRSKTNSSYQIIGVEPDRCASLKRSLSLGRTAQILNRSIAAPALNVDTTPDEVFAIVNSMEGVELFQVSDSEIAMATSYLAAHQMNVDPGAASAVAAALFKTLPRRYKHLVIILTGAGARQNLERFDAEGLLVVSQDQIVKEFGHSSDLRSVSITTRSTSLVT